MERLFVLYSLKDDVSWEEYEEWLAEEHYPWGRAVPSQTKVQGHLVVDDYDDDVDDPKWDNIAIIDITDRGEWAQDMEEFDHEELGSADYHWEKWFEHVDEHKIFFTEPSDA